MSEYAVEFVCVICWHKAFALATLFDAVVEIQITPCIVNQIYFTKMYKAFRASTHKNTIFHYNFFFASSCSFFIFHLNPQLKINVCKSFFKFSLFLFRFVPVCFGMRLRFGRQTLMRAIQIGSQKIYSCREEEKNIIPKKCKKFLLSSQ